VLSKTEQESNLKRLTESIAQTSHVILAVLFGSRARGDYDEYSDYDILVVFDTDESLWQNRRKLFEQTSKSGLFTQLLTRSLREVREETEPTFLETVLRDGKVIYSKYPLTFPAQPLSLTPMRIVTFSLKNLDQRRKMKLQYQLYGKQKEGQRRQGLIQKIGGRRLGYGGVLVPEPYLEEVTDLLDQLSATWEELKVYIQQERTSQNSTVAICSHRAGATIARKTR